MPAVSNRDQLELDLVVQAIAAENEDGPDADPPAGNPDDHYWRDRIGQYSNPWLDPEYAAAWDDLVSNIRSGMNEDQAWKKYHHTINKSYARRGSFDVEEGNHAKGADA
jgi:hypothetical protein